LKSGLQKSASRDAEPLQRKVAPLPSSSSSTALLKAQKHKQNIATSRVSSPSRRPSLSPSRSA